MAKDKKRRKLELHRLTISGLKKESDYTKFLTAVREHAGADARASFKLGGKTHCLKTIETEEGSTRFLFYSFHPGTRPDVLNTSTHEISPSPLAGDETFVDWTHIVGTPHKGRYRLLIERVQSGIWPTTLEHYLQELVDLYLKGSKAARMRQNAQEPVTVSVEPEPGTKFIDRLENLARIRSVMVRTVRPNPGWGDLQNELSGASDASDAHRAEVTFTARRNASLSHDKGVVDYLRSLASTGDLGFARVEGDNPGGETDSFSTEQLGIHGYKYLELNDAGQVQHNDAWNKFIDFLNSQK